MIAKPLLVRIEAGSRSYGLEMETSDTDTVLIYDSHPSQSPLIFPTFCAEVDYLPDRYIYPDPHRLSDLFNEYEAHQDAEAMWRGFQSLRDRIVMASPQLLKHSLESLVNRYRNYWDSTGNLKHLMYVKFWSDAIKDLGDLGFYSSIHRDNVEEYRQIRMGASDEIQQSIISDAVRVLDTDWTVFKVTPDLEVYQEMKNLVENYRATQEEPSTGTDDPTNDPETVP